MQHFKSLLILATALLAFPYPQASALPLTKKIPNFDLGIKAGANFASISGSHWENTYKPGVVIGGFLGAHKNKLGLQVEVLLNTSHYTTSSVIDSVHKGDFRSLYLDIPILFQYKLIGAKLAPKIWLMAGPQFSSLLSVTNLNDYKGDSKQYFKSSMVSIVAGAELRYLKFTAGARYILGVTPINNTSNVPAVQRLAGDTWSNRSYQLYLGFRFF